MSIETASAFSVSLLQTWPARVDHGGGEGPSADFVFRRDRPAPAPQPVDDAAAAIVLMARQSLIAGNLRIELDREAGRFVQTLTDPNTMEVLRRFPYESQLAYARAVGAYMNAKAVSL